MTKPISKCCKAPLINLDHCIECNETYGNPCAFPHWSDEEIDTFYETTKRPHPFRSILNHGLAWPGSFRDRDKKSLVHENGYSKEEG